jgi:hypothetical protein
MRLYNRVNAQSPSSHTSTAASASTDNSNPFLSGSDNEHVFLVYLCVGLVALFLSFADSHGASFIFAMQEFARELISLTVAMSRIYAAERPDLSRRWFPRISAGLSSVFCCLRSRSRPPISDSQSRRSDISVTSKPARKGLHRRICMV